MLVLPSVAFGIGQVYWFPPKEITPAKMADINLIAEITFMIMYTNNAINFILYIMLGSRFRSDLRNMCFCKRDNLRSTNGNIRTNSSSNKSVAFTIIQFRLKSFNVVILNSVLKKWIFFMLNLELRNSYAIFLSSDSIRVICYPRNETFVFKTQTLIDLSLGFEIPFCILFTGNMTILIRILSSNTLRKSSVTKSETSKTAPQNNNPVTQWTVITQILKTTFFVLICPSVTFGIGQVYWFLSIGRIVCTNASCVRNKCYVNVHEQCYKFVLYMMFGSKFRADLKSLFVPLTKFLRIKNNSRSIIMFTQVLVHMCLIVIRAHHIM
ncbi:hypothetical protein MAR_023272 [Mya arenaria]|uniref:G-protein coupled receptors family 1 profile domain-containing protein n=1 Tax=Mya arenaria TaxID=6604 RepID=A0ABY7DQQ4_MYAAR|nr:hypothetical protein MAR_023272 [Mya arenaria]